MTVLDGIFCLEGEWDPLLTNKLSVEPQLRMLANLGICKGVIHRDVATASEFRYYTNKWLQKKYAAYKVAYFAFHGTSSNIMLGNKPLSLDDMATMVAGRATGRVIYFGSCQTLAAPEDELRRFCHNTGAKAVVGYTKPVDWLASASFDFMLLPELLRASSMKPVYTRLVATYPDVTKALGLRMAMKSWVSPRKIAQNAAASTSPA